MKPRDAIENLPPYLPGENPKEAGIIKLASNENPLGPSPKALERIKKVLKDLYFYPDQNSLLLKEALAKKFEVSVDNVIIGNGSDEIMQFCAAAYLSSGDEVIISKNTFSTYEFVTRLFEGKPVFVDLKNYTYDLDGIAAAITEKTKIIFLCNPNNPTGTIFSEKEFEAFIGKVPDNIIVIVDEAYAEYADSADFPKTINYIAAGKNIVLLRTFSKIYGLAGLRVGFGITKPEIAKYLNMVKLPFNVNRLAQSAALAALEDEEFVLKSLRSNNEGKEFLYSNLYALNSTLSLKETQANFIFIETKKSANNVFIEMIREKIIIRPLSSFGLPQAIRVTIGTRTQNELFINALRKTLAA